MRHLRRNRHDIIFFRNRRACLGISLRVSLRAADRDTRIPGLDIIESVVDLFDLAITAGDQLVNFLPRIVRDRDDAVRMSDRSLQPVHDVGIFDASQISRAVLVVPERDQIMHNNCIFAAVDKRPVSPREQNPVRVITPRVLADTKQLPDDKSFPVQRISGNDHKFRAVPLHIFLIFRIAEHNNFVRHSAAHIFGAKIRNQTFCQVVNTDTLASAFDQLESVYDQNHLTLLPYGTGLRLPSAAES